VEVNGKVEVKVKAEEDEERTVNLRSASTLTAALAYLGEA